MKALSALRSASLASELVISHGRDERGADQPDPSVSADRSFLIACGEALFKRIKACLAKGSKIVGAFEPDDGGDAGKAQDIPLDAVKGRGSARVVIIGEGL